LQSIISALLSFYAANQPLALFLFLLVEEAGAPLWCLPGDVLIMQAGSQPGRTPMSVAMIVLAATAGATIGSSLLYFVVRRGGRPLVVVRHRRPPLVISVRVLWAGKFPDSSSEPERASASDPSQAAGIGQRRSRKAHGAGMRTDSKCVAVEPTVLERHSQARQQPVEVARPVLSVRSRRRAMSNQCALHSARIRSASPVLGEHARVEEAGVVWEHSVRDRRGPAGVDRAGRGVTGANVAGRY
jgi:hypothetical protein